jgi:hypothetical protein
MDPRRSVTTLIVAAVLGIAAIGCGSSSPNTANVKGDQGITPPNSLGGTKNTAAPGGHN